MAPAEETYVSVDIECDGLVPAMHSMLSLGAAAFDGTGALLDTFSANLEPLPDCAPLPQTMAWWARFPLAWSLCRKDAEDPMQVMPRFVSWVTGLPGSPIFVAYPAAFDFGFVHYYLARFTGGNPFGFTAVDIRSFAMGLTGRPFGATAKCELPVDWLPRRPHTHVALDDALEQGEWFCRMLRISRGQAGA